jgi:AAA ATPase domain
LLRLRVFVSSPGDVGAERAVALAVAERLQLEFRGQVQFETYLWERSLLRATETFQAQILDIQQADLALFILWARVGTPLPLEQFSRPDGSGYSSGTEYEFERALDGFQERNSPEIFCYLKTAEVRLSMKDREQRAMQVAELDAVSQFVDRWFRNPDGTFRSAFYNFEKTAQFEELIEVHLREWIRDRLKSVEQPAAQQQVWKGSPFRGLQAFDFEHALIYCGRTGLVSEVIDVLRRRAAAGHGFVMITGMSGVGKSSLVKAGVLPILTRPRVVEHVIGWRRAIFKPDVGSQSSLAGFAAALLDENALPELAAEATPLAALLTDPPALTLAVKRALERATKKAREASPDPDPEGNVRLVVVCDQFEAIFDETVTAAERAAFCEALRTMILTGDVWVMATLRADFFSRCAVLPERFRDLFIEQGGIYAVGGPRPAEISQMIRRPAMMAGVTFERRGDPEEGLDDVLRDAASGNATVLPLLQFTLDELWRRSAGSGVLRFADYENLGGLQGALRLRADEVFSGLPAQVQASLPKVLAGLVHTDPTDDRRILQNRISRDQFSNSPDCLALIAAFVDAHLLVSDQAPDGTAVVGLAHEALLREWPPAVRWIEQNRGLLRLRAGITAAAMLWRNDNSQEGRLLTGALLKDATRLLKEMPEMLAPEERGFVELSIAHERRKRRRLFKQSAAAAALVGLAVLIPTIGVGQLSYGMAFVRTLPAVWNDSQRIPVSAAAVANLQTSIDSLGGFLHGVLREVAGRPELNTWAVAQLSLALHELPAAPHELASAPTISGQQLRAIMSENRDVSCQCWRETEDKLPHSMASAWVIYSLAQYDQRASPGEIDAILDRQARNGWWAMFPATGDERNASTSATAWTTLALHHQSKKNLISPEQRARVEAAIKNASAWLIGRALPDEARWTEYPPDQIFERGYEYLAVSALVIHVLRTVAGSAQFDSLWLDQLPQAVPSPLQSEMAKGYVFRSKTQFTLDDVRHYRFPWMLTTTVDAYANGTAVQKARAALWIEEAFRKPLTPSDMHNEHWTIAETLFALRHVRSVLQGKAGGPAVSVGASGR